MQRRLVEIIESLAQPKMLLVGDIMLDHYVFGDAERISQEAPVQVLRAVSEEHRLGGAGSVANNLAALGAQVSVCGVVGRDDAGERVMDLLRHAKVSGAGVLRLKDRPTTTKTRFVGRAQHRIPQQVLRVDTERTDLLQKAEEDRILEKVRQSVRGVACVVISDYGKGVLTPRVTRAIIGLCRQAGKPVLIDPAPTGDYSKYRGATCLTPNRVETALACGVGFGNNFSVRKAGHKLLNELRLAAIAITLDKDGALLIERGKQGRAVPTRPRVIFDNAGAGDMFISVLAVVLSGGNSFLDAARLANVAAGLEVEKFGVQTVTWGEVIRDILEEPHQMGGKVRDLPSLLGDVARHRMLGQTVVFTNGCFDLIHQGHIELLNFSARQGDVLIVGLNSDRSVKMNKGAGRPFCPQKERARVLAGLEAVDYVVIFDTKKPIPLIKAIRPDILVKGGDYDLGGVVGRDIVESYGGRVVLAPLVRGLSTSQLVKRIQANGSNRESGARADRPRKKKRRKSK